MPSKRMHSKQIVHLYARQHWQVSYVNDAARFFWSLSTIVPYGSILSFEGYEPARKFRLFLRAHAAEKPVEYLTDDRVWIEQVRFTSAFAECFVSFQHDHFKSVKFEHLHGFSKTNQMLFWFHDAFTGGDLALARTISASRLRRFCLKLGPQYFRKGPIC